MAADLDGRVVLITGANTGIGRVTATELAGRGAHVFLACRSAEKAQPVLDEINSRAGIKRGAAAEFLPLDLTDLASVRNCAALFLKRKLPLHILINNAGLAGQRGLTKDGFELAFGVNHLGHYLLTELLLKTLRRSAPARIVIVSSRGHYDAKSIDWDALRQSTPSITGLNEYAVSKLCNVLHGKRLTERLDGSGIEAFSLHPGVVASDVWRSVPWPFRSVIKLFMLSTEDGARTSIYCATSPDVAGKSGAYFDDCRERTPSQLALSSELAHELERRCNAWL